MDNEKFGNFIKRLRKENKMTQKELSEKLHITDKAVSKWERGLSFPDITMLTSIAEIFNIDVSELLNSEVGKKQEKIDIEKIVNQRLEEIQNKITKKKLRTEKLLKIIGIIFALIGTIGILVLILYHFIINPKGYEFIYSNSLYIIYEVIIISLSISAITLLKIGNNLKNTIKNIIVIILAILFTIINILFIVRNSNEQTIISFSQNLKNEIVLKYDKEKNKIKRYNYIKFFIFAKPYDDFSYETTGKIKIQWINNNTCSVIYEGIDKNIHDYVATFSSVGDYYYVLPTIHGKWENLNKRSNKFSIRCTQNGIYITKNSTTEFFHNYYCSQFGLTTLMLYKEDVPKYIITFNEDCVVDRASSTLKDGSTLSIIEISFDISDVEILNRTTLKVEN